MLAMIDGNMTDSGLRNVTDVEWQREVPDELLDLYMGGHWVGSTEKGDHRWEKLEFTSEEVGRLREKYPKWFKDDRS